MSRLDNVPANGTASGNSDENVNAVPFGEAGEKFRGLLGRDLIRCFGHSVGIFRPCVGVRQDLFVSILFSFCLQRASTCPCLAVPNGKN